MYVCKPIGTLLQVSGLTASSSLTPRSSRVRRNEIMAECPICGGSFPLSSIDAHVNACLDDKTAREWDN